MNCFLIDHECVILFICFLVNFSVTDKRTEIIIHLMIHVTAEILMLISYSICNFYYWQ